MGLWIWDYFGDGHSNAASGKGYTSNVDNLEENSLTYERLSVLVAAFSPDQTSNRWFGLAT